MFVVQAAGKRRLPPVGGTTPFGVITPTGGFAGGITPTGGSFGGVVGGITPEGRLGDVGGTTPEGEGRSGTGDGDCDKPVWGTTPVGEAVGVAVAAGKGGGDAVEGFELGDGFSDIGGKLAWLGLSAGIAEIPWSLEFGKTPAGEEPLIIASDDSVKGSCGLLGDADSIADPFACGLSALGVVSDGVVPGSEEAGFLGNELLAGAGGGTFPVGLGSTQA